MYIMLVVTVTISFAFEENCSAFNILNNKINSCQRNTISCMLAIYIKEFNGCKLSLPKLQEQEKIVPGESIKKVEIIVRNLRTFVNNSNNTTCIFLKKCQTTCKSSTSDSSLSKCYNNCFTVAYNCSSPKKIIINKSSYKMNTYEIVIVSVILIWFGLLVIKYSCFHNSHEFNRKIHVTTFTSV